MVANGLLGIHHTFGQDEMWKIKINGIDLPVEIVGRADKKFVSVQIPYWQQMYNDYRIWKVKKRDLKFYAN